MVVLHQCGLHVVETLELDEAATHRLAGVFVCAETDFKGLELGEVLLDLFLRGAKGEVAWRRKNRSEGAR